MTTKAADFVHLTFAMAKYWGTLSCPTLWVGWKFAE